MNKRKYSAFLLYVLALFMSVVPVTVCILLYFPLWRRAGSGAVISGAVLILLLVAFVPLIRAIKTYFKSPSAYMIWFCSFILFLLLSNIAKDMTVISFVGFVSNLIGASLFKLAKRRTESESEKNEE